MELIKFRAKDNNSQPKKVKKKKQIHSKKDFTSSSNKKPH